VAGDVDLFGASITMGSWLDDLNRHVFYISTSDNGVGSLVRLGATRSSNDWIWERGATSSGAPAITMMKLDGVNRLTLFDPATAASGTIVLDPGSPQPGIFINGQRVLTAGAAALSYLPVAPIQLAVGVNNVVGADALAVGSAVQATGRNAAAFGSNATASGENSTAFGDHTQAQGFGQFVAGSYNIPQGIPNSAAAGDQVFVIGNGIDNTHRSNAITVLRNGNVGIGTAAPVARLAIQGNANISGDLNVTGAVSIPPQGDLSMGEFTKSVNP
jgi:hypothetical protein